MLRSMTGFGAGRSEEGSFAVGAEARSVNHRHLNVKLRLGGELVELEADVDALVKKRCARGSVSVFVTVETSPDNVSSAIDPEAAARYRADIARVAAAIGAADEVSMETLLGLPGVVVGAQAIPLEPKKLKRCVLSAVDGALERMLEMRAAEGAAIQADLEKHAAAMRAVVEKIERRMPAVVKSHQKALEKRVGELIDGKTSLQAGDLAREVALLADRLDVSEEVARVASHLAQLDSFLAKGGTIGRKLDFLVQEVFREVNTIGSKCSDAKVAHWVVDAKAHVERLREQVQNVE